MKRKTTLLVAGLASASFAVGGAGVALASSSAASHTLKFTSVQTAQHSIGKYGFADSDKDVANGKVIGYDVVNGTYNPKTSTITVDVAASLSGGILYGHGTGSLKTGKFKGKVTGGTGIFKGAEGTITGQATGKHGQDEHLVVVYH
ncbi:MAG: hypothetical protein INR66_24420 [Gordonia polyisoprenivorans]|nr:hypothetical protein [Gordonia polyisoprenivorans]